jgi:hypothetical protein
LYEKGQPEIQKPNPVIGLFFKAAMGLAHSAVAFDYTVTTAFGNGLARGAVRTIGSNGLAWGAIRAIGSNGLAWGAVGTIGSDGLAWCAVGTIGSNGLAWSAIRTIGSDGLAWSAIGTIGSNSLTLWGLVVAIFSDQAFFFQAIVATFGYGLAEHRVRVFHLRGSLVSGWQGESSAGQHRECKAKQ